MRAPYSNPKLGNPISTNVSYYATSASQPKLSLTSGNLKTLKSNKYYKVLQIIK